MALTKAQIAKAARLYSLAMAALGDAGGAQTDDETQIMYASQGRAEAALARLGYGKSQLLTIWDCIHAVCKA
ncbi:hypothetical protein ABH945_007213 [Paraburkholderia sp. GAS333]|uniref:hypothetical protein n=1 Tax=Paraburkholderia sp. GAS333 TaxID=3156279 RepID=UPI003D1A593A